MANIKRLKRLLKVLKKAPKEKFNMKVYMNDTQFEKPLDIKLASIFTEVDCRSAGCAAGWLGSDKQTREEGFVLKGSQVIFLDKGVHLEGYSACEAYLNISSSEVGYIFSPESYPEGWNGSGEGMSKIKKSAVIKRVKKVIAKHDPSIFNIGKYFLSEDYKNA